MSAINKNTNGSIMIAALIVALITGSLVGLFLKTVTLEVENSYRARMAFQAVNLAEAGLEHAMYAMIKDDWSGWTSGGNGYFRDNLPYVSYSWRNEYRGVKVYVEPDRGNDASGNPLPPLAVSEGSITLKNGIKISRQIFVELTRGASQDPTSGGFWGNGILGKRGVSLGGNKHFVDSFHSGNNPMAYTDIGDIYTDQVATNILGNKVANGRGSVASNSVKIDDIVVGNADIFGSIATGSGQAGSDVSSIVGPNGSIINQDTQKGDDTFNGKIDTAYVAYDFYANIPDVSTPTLDTNIVQTTLSSYTIGSSGTTSQYELTGLNIGSNEIYTMEGSVTLYVNGDITVRGELAVAPDATVELYVSGDVDIGGNGIVNESLPENFLIFHTQSEADAAVNGASQIKLHGTAPMSAALYAPNSDVSLKGGGGDGTMYGAIVADTVTFAGNNYEFHYDEALEDLADRRGDPNTANYIPEVNTWVELTDASEKKNMATILTDGL